MRTLSIPLPIILSGFVAVLVGYASSATIIWQAAPAAGVATGQIAGRMTTLGLAMGISTLALTLWYHAPVLTAWSTPGAASLVTGLQGVLIQDAIGVFIVVNAFIVLCGTTGLFARLIKIIPHSLVSAMLAGILLRFGLQALNSLNSEFILCGSMLPVWLVLKVITPRYAVIAAMLVGITIALVKGDIITDGINLSPVLPAFTVPHFSLAHSISIALLLFLVTIASQSAPGIATMKASGYPLPVSPLIVFTGLLALLFSPFGIYSICIAAITAVIYQSPEAHPDANRRWLATAAAGIFHILTGVLGGSVIGLMAALPVSWIRILAGLALLGTISGSLFQALHSEAGHDAAIVTFLATANGLTVSDVESALWELVVGGIRYSVLTLFRRAQLRWYFTRHLSKPVTETTRRAEPIGHCNIRRAA